MNRKNRMSAIACICMLLTTCTLTVSALDTVLPQGMVRGVASSAKSDAVLFPKMRISQKGEDSLLRKIPDYAAQNLRMDQGGNLFFDGQPVRYFYDPPADVTYWDGNGVVDLIPRFKKGKYDGWYQSDSNEFQMNTKKWEKWISQKETVRLTEDMQNLFRFSARKSKAIEEKMNTALRIGADTDTEIERKTSIKTGQAATLRKMAEKFLTRQGNEIWETEMITLIRVALDRKTDELEDTGLIPLDSKTPIKVEWHTYETFQAWIEQEKKEFDVFVKTGAWSQAHADSAMKKYGQILEEIKKGWLLSRTVEGRTNIIICASPRES